jgi:SAM-dependent methyltransferase
MAVTFSGQVIDGITCYAPELADSFDGYPEEGFDLTVQVEEQSFWCRSRNRILRRVLQRYGPKHHAKMLEIGCGTGTVLRALTDVQNLHLTGSEIYLAGLRQAKRRLPGVEFIQVDARRLPFVNEFDIIGAFDVIEHIDEDEQVLANLWQGLVANGLLLVTVPQHPWMWSRLDELVHHQRRYTRRDLRDKLQRAGFDVLRMTSFVTSLFPLMVAQRAISRARPVTDAAAALDSEVRFSPFTNACFDAVMRVDETLIRCGASLPFGGTLLAVARKRPGKTAE